MPAYRSPAEAEVRDAVVARLRQIRPQARIMHEVNACGFGNRIDVLAVGAAEIIAVEIKSQKDKLDRLPDQIRAMRGCAHHVIAALHEKFLVQAKWCKSPHLDPPDAARGARVWAYPETGQDRGFSCSKWADPDLTVQNPLPADALHMLWAGELRQVCADLGIAAGSRVTMPFMVNALRWQANGGDLTKAICRALRARKCIEADPAIEVAA